MIVTGTLKEITLNEGLGTKIARNVIVKPIEFLNTPIRKAGRIYHKASDEEKGNLRRLAIGTGIGTTLGSIGGIPGVIAGSAIGTGIAHLYNKFKSKR